MSSATGTEGSVFQEVGEICCTCRRWGEKEDNCLFGDCSKTGTPSLYEQTCHFWEGKE